MSVVDEQILILCKTYPSPSEKYVETSCVAGVRGNGSLIRLFPVPFRLVSADKQFKKWQWVTAKIEKARKDHRPESYQIKIDTLDCSAEVLSTRNSWALRRAALHSTPVFHTFSDIERERAANGTSLALLRPSKLVGLDIEQVRPAEWTEEEIAKLLAEQRQGALFEEDRTELKTLRKLPFAFHYRYKCVGMDGAIQEFRHKIVDWEAGALFWRCQREYGKDWERKFRERLWDYMSARDLIFLMGNIHRFQNQWLIVSLLYPPVEMERTQGDFFA